MKPDRVETDEQLESRMGPFHEPVEDREVETVVEGEGRRARVEADLPHPVGVDRPAGDGLEQQRGGVGVAHGVEGDGDAIGVVVDAEHGLFHAGEDPRLLTRSLETERQVDEDPADLGDDVPDSRAALDEHLVVHGPDRACDPRTTQGVVAT